MLFRPRYLLLGIAVCAVLFLAHQWSLRLTPALPSVAVSATETFTEGGWYPGKPFAHAVGVRAWGSWSGSDDNVGTLILGPFPAPRILRFGLGGYPDKAGNSIVIENLATGQKAPIPYSAVGEEWALCDHPLPSYWEGKPLRLIVTDASTGNGGWLAITEPLRGGRGDGSNALIETLTAWTLNGLLLGLLYFAAARQLAAHSALAPQWQPLAAGAVVALCGYVAYWAYFFHPWVGWFVSGASLTAAVAIVCRRTDSRASSAASVATEAPTVGLLLLAIGAFQLALLHLIPTAYDFYTFAANRFREALPADNFLPHRIAERLFAGNAPSTAEELWRATDHPPLQIGWQLLTWPASKLLGLERQTASGTSAVWFQLLWIAAAYGLLRSFQIASRRAAGWVVIVALSGFFLQHTVFTWPKLAAGAFTIGAFACVFLPLSAATPRSRGLWAALFIALAWLTHLSVLFSFLPLVPWLLWRACRHSRQTWWPAAAVLAALVLPWLGYQQIDPPSQVLLKYHLAGDTTLNPRGVWETVRASYERIGWDQAWADKLSNFRRQFGNSWGDLFEISPAGAVHRLQHEFFHTGRALAWWPIVTLLAVVAAGRRVFSDLREVLRLAGWLLATLALWCLLMFGRDSASLHHASFAAMIGLFVLFAVLLERADPRWALPLALLQLGTLATTWAGPNHIIQGPIAGLAPLLLAGVPLAWLAIRSFLSPAPAALPAVVRVPWCPTALSTWWQRPRLNVWVLAVFALLLFLRKPHSLHTPQLWAEDGSIFLTQVEIHGTEALITPYMGYLHTIPRIVAQIAQFTLDPAWWPAFYNGFAFLVWLGAVARFFTARFDHLPGRPWLALALFAVPHSGEVHYNITNLQWLTALVLVQQLFVAAPATRFQRVSDIVILTLIALTGPFALALLPLFFARWVLPACTFRPLRLKVRELFAPANRAALYAFVAILLCSAVQAWFVRGGPRFDYQNAPVDLWEILIVVSRRLVVWPLLGTDLALNLPPSVVGLIGTLFLAAVFAWALRRDPHRPLRLWALGAFALVALAGIYRTRPDAWGYDNIYFGDRYFYIPRVLLAWLLIWEFHSTSRLVARLARLACLATLVVHLHEFIIPAPPDYHWRDNVEPIRRGTPAQIHTLPEGWFIDYPGRPYHLR
ncbi:MAG: hypothetical protein V4773_08135 [Verrucomicrobiota bacterium]